jgi:hypothetical protein
MGRKNRRSPPEREAAMDPRRAEQLERELQRQRPEWTNAAPEDES